MARIKEEDLRLNIIINSAGKTQLSELEKQTKMNTMSLDELRKHLKLTNLALGKAVPGTQNWKNLQAEVNRTKQRLDELKDGGQSVSNTLKQFFNGIGGKFAIGTLAVKGFTAALDLGKKIFEDMKTQTQAFGDQWNITIAGAKAGWQQFIANISSGNDVIKGSISSAIQAGREAAAMRDELFERQNSLAIEEQKAATFIATQNAIAMDSSKSANERIAALDLVLGKEEELAGYRKNVAEQELDAAKVLLQDRTRLEDDVLKMVVDEYEKNREIITQANEYNGLLDKRATLQRNIRGYSVMDENGAKKLERMKLQLSEYDKQILSTSQDVIAMAQNVKQYNLGNDDLVKAYVEGVKKVEAADTALETARQGQARRRGALRNQITSEAKAATEKEYAERLRIITASNNAELLEIKKGFAEKTLSEQEYNDKTKQLETKLLLQKIELNKKYGKDALELENELQNKTVERELETQRLKKEAADFVATLEVDKTKIAIAAEEKRYQEDLKAFEKSKSALTDQAKVKEDIEAKHRRNMAKIDADADNERLQLQAANNKLEIDSIRNAHMERISTMKQGSLEQKQALKAMRLEIANAELSHMEQYLRELEALLGKQEGNGSTDEEITKTKQAIAQAKAEIIQVKAVLNGESGRSAFSGTGTGDLFGVSESQWESLFGHLKDGKFAAEDLKATIAGIGGAAEEGLKIASQAIAMVNAQEQKELKDYQKINDKKKKDLQKRLSAGLISQSQYDRSLEDLQEEQDAKEEEMQERQAERQKKLSITQAIIQSALAVAKTFAEWGYPYGIAPAAIMAALGAAQVALIAATPTGFAEGGEVTRAQDGRKFNARLSPNKRGFIGSPTILVGEEGGEYVIPADGLRNPSLAPFIGSIEAARRAGTLRSINFGAVSPAMSAFAPAMATGGASSSMAVVTPDYSVIIAEMQALGQKLETVRAVVPLLGKGGIVEAMDSYETIKKRGRL